ncbi:MAG TPA: DUF4342 domain-containing protein [Candidatus Methanofastidiosa archaeon]|nr:DUF4342 domain-containing protein [Candidatus Methanofastidiosa archaeon]HPR42130.1 DUF4342 domain-containing protein [Candidatus Methanofastidiosa archaeon]
MSEKKTSSTEFKVSADELVSKVKELIHEGNIRRIKVKQDEKVLMEVPLSVSVIGIVLAPTLAALGALAALVTECTIEIEREIEE